MQVLRTLVLVALLPAALCGDNVHVVSLEDVTGTTARPSYAEAAAAVTGVTQVGYDDRSRPGGGRPAGVVSLEDVTGTVDHTVPVVIGHPLPDLAAPRPAHPGRQQVGVVSLEDVTGHVDNTVPPVIGHPLPSLPRPRPAYPGRPAGVVSLEDVTGQPDNTVPVAPLPFGPYPQRPLVVTLNRPYQQAYQQPAYNQVDRQYNTYRYDGSDGSYYSPNVYSNYRSTDGQASVVCAEQGSTTYQFPEPQAARSEIAYDRPALGRHRARRSPKPIGVVSLENVAGPVAAHYPAYGPPAYVRPNYYPNYYGGWYQRPRPYVYAVPCIGLFCL